MVLHLPNQCFLRIIADMIQQNMILIGNEYFSSPVEMLNTIVLGCHSIGFLYNGIFN